MQITAGISSIKLLSGVNRRDSENIINKKTL